MKKYTKLAVLCNNYISHTVEGLIALVFITKSCIKLRKKKGVEKHLKAKINMFIKVTLKIFVNRIISIK